MSEPRILLTGLNGTNPLGFMAALGCLRLLSKENAEVRLGWDKHGFWRPHITGFDSADAVVEAVSRAARKLSAEEDLSISLGDNITVSPGEFRRFATQAATSTEWSPFAAAFGCEALEDKNGRIQYTKLCFITGSGHQNFLETIRLLRQRTTEVQLRRAMFKTMEPMDRGLSMRWDPGDAKEYALQWSNPGPEGVQSSWGAYRLAIEALPFFPAVPAPKWLKTSGFAFKDTFQWPIWRDPITIDSIKSLISLDINLEDPVVIREMGIEELFQSQRVRIGEGANFKVSFRPASPVTFDVSAGDSQSQ